MDILTPEDVEFLRDLANELKTQDTFSTAKPVFYQIEETVKIHGMDQDYSDDYEIVIGEDHDDFDNVEDAKKFLDEVYAAKYRDLSVCNSLDDLVDYCHQHGIEAFVGYYSNHSKKSGSFLTYRAAKKYLELNYYHHNSTVHTYCDHAWRKPELKRLLEIIEKFSEVNNVTDA